MISLHKSHERGRTRTDWLQSWHSFSFGDYYDPANMGFGSLRVINDDIVAAGAGFPMHGHRDMEIVTYVISGALEHKDSLGNGSIIKPGDVQRMSAGTGIRHSEFNPSPDTPVRLLQIWIVPAREGLAPGYEQRDLSAHRQGGKLTLLASPDGHHGSVTIHQDATIQVLDLEKDQAFNLSLRAGRRHWLQAARGRFAYENGTLEEGDGLAIEGAASLKLQAQETGEILLFDLA